MSASSAMYTLHVCAYAVVLCMGEGHTHIIIGPEQPAKVCSAKFSFCTETQKFSPTKVFCYMFSAIWYRGGEPGPFYHVRKCDSYI